MPYDTRNVLSASRYFLAKTKSACGANATGGGGFQPGNTCASGRSESSTPKPKLTKAEREANSKQAFEDNMKTKSPADQAAFRKARADKIFIPPAWSEIEYFGKDADIIAMGRDAKGRKQRQENPGYRQGLSDKNNARIDKELLPRMKEIRIDLRAAATAGDEEAKVLYLITQTGFRIGGKGDGKAEKEAFGASSIKGEHVSVKGDTVTFDFPGKKGVAQKHSITDSTIAGMMTGLEKGKPVFRTNERKVREAWQQNYGGKKVHDIRHVVATETAEKEIKKIIPPPPENKKQSTKIQKDVSEVVGKKLGNNANQSLKTYISPSVWKLLES